MHAIMDESKYLMWLKRKKMLMKSSSSRVVQVQAAASTVPMAVGDSWEEQAFAEDAAGPMGGCIWPPRSYSCSFCGREFRSAQALGGHMNVHRRDRARLKQQSPLMSSESPNTTTLLLPPPRRENFLSPLSSNPNSSSAELGLDYSKKGFVDTNLGLNLQSVAVKNNINNDNNEVMMRCKRQKTNVLYLMQPCLLQSDGFKGIMTRRNSSMDELDLELRLGDPTTKVL